jgi:hypothetical protein
MIRFNIIAVMRVVARLGGGRSGGLGGKRIGGTDPASAARFVVELKPADIASDGGNAASVIPARAMSAISSPAMGRPAKQLPAKQLPAKQLPAKQLPAKQLPAKRVPAKPMRVVYRMRG